MNLENMQTDKYTYEDVVKETTGLEQLGEVYLPYVAAKIVYKYCPKCISYLDLDNFTPKLYGTLWKIIYSGKSCCHLENDAKWDFVTSSNSFSSSAWTWLLCNCIANRICILSEHCWSFKQVNLVFLIPDKELDIWLFPIYGYFPWLFDYFFDILADKDKLNLNYTVQNMKKILIKKLRGISLSSVYISML